MPGVVFSFPSFSTPHHGVEVTGWDSRWERIGSSLAWVTVGNRCSETAILPWSMRLVSPASSALGKVYAEDCFHARSIPGNQVAHKNSLLNDTENSALLLLDQTLPQWHKTKLRSNINHPSLLDFIREKKKVLIDFVLFFINKLHAGTDLCPYTVSIKAGINLILSVLSKL